MCGIAGWLDFQDPQRDSDLLLAMTNAIIHRGPDGVGSYESGPIHLGHRRLSIIDLVGSPQPMSNEDSSIWLIFNGEIFNFEELRRRLLSAGHRFRTAGDTETIVHAYEEYGEQFLDHLQGQFAIAIWDQRDEKLILARDRMGQLPLYYYKPDSEHIYFASELKALLKHPSVQKHIDPAAVDSYFAYKYIPEPQSIYKNVFKLPAAHKLVVTKTSSRIERYWQPPFADEIEIVETDALEKLDWLLNDAVRCRMVADVPLGAFLSGGIDSSLVVAYMAANSSRPVKTFTIGFDQDSHDERRYARLVANQFGTEHHEFVVTSDAADVVPKMAAAFDEPFADSSALPVYYLAQMTRRHVSVALNGDGGDESFGGYGRYFATAKFDRYRKLPALIRTILGGAAWTISFTQFRNLPIVRRLVRWRHLEESSLGRIYQQSVQWPVESRSKLFSIDLLNQLTIRNDQVAEAVDSAIGNDVLNRILQGDQRTYLPGDLLVKVDRMCMQHSLEGRSPFLDNRIVEFASSLHSSMKTPQYQSKHLLKRLMEKFFSNEFIHRKKMGFGVPVADWFKKDKRLKQMLLSENSDTRYLSESEIRRLLVEHENGKVDNSGHLWSILMFKSWLNEC